MLLVKRVVAISTLLLLLIVSSGCNNVEFEGPEIAFKIKGPKLSARHIREGENQGNEYLSRNTGIFNSSLPMVGQNTN